MIRENIAFYFEYRDNCGKLKKFEITSNADTSWLLLETIEPPCNDRTVVAIGATIAELVEWTLNNFK